jgi:hypothetical protein
MSSIKNQGILGQQQSSTSRRAAVFCVSASDRRDRDQGVEAAASRRARFGDGSIVGMPIVLYGDHVRFVMSLKMW